jgi:hypothetical protein
MTNPDYRALCAELVDALAEQDRCWMLINDARAALAQSEPMAPTDEELEELADVMNVSGNPVPAMRRALELWGCQ